MLLLFPSSMLFLAGTFSGPGLRCIPGLAMALGPGLAPSPGICRAVRGLLAPLAGPTCVHVCACVLC